MGILLWLLAVLGVAVILEQSLGFKLGWRLRTPIILLAVPSFVVPGAGLLLIQPSVGTVCLALLCTYSVFNLLRVAHNRTAEAQLFRSSNITGLWLGMLTVLLAVATAVTWEWHFALQVALGILAVLQLIAAVGLWRSTQRQLVTTQIPNAAIDAARGVADAKLPSITVAIPARNEDQQLQACLDAILASDYPKLEVIVLDDSSADRTPEIIRSYAHAGVRFVRGSEPNGSWLPKNQVYDRLAREANGKLILFCGVDVRLSPGSIRALEQVLFTRRKAMIGVLPQNRLLQRLPLTQSMRYYWELAPPRRRFHRPPVLSSCWMIEKAELEHSGGFAAVKRSMSPESHFAREAIRHDAYSFVCSSPALGITSEKDVHEQYETAVFMRYPQLHRRPELVLLLSVGELALLAGPVVVIPLALLSVASTITGSIAAVALAALALNALNFARIQQQIFTRASFVNALLRYLPAVLYDVCLLNWSMYKYEFASVIWKGRPVHGPVMHAFEVIPRLPQLPPHPPGSSPKP